MLVCKKCHRQGGCLSAVTHTIVVGVCRDCKGRGPCLNCDDFNFAGVGRDEIITEVKRLAPSLSGPPLFWLEVKGEWVSVPKEVFAEAEAKAGITNPGRALGARATDGFFLKNSKGRITYTGTKPIILES